MSAGTTSTYGPLDFARDSGVSRETLTRVSIFVDLLKEWNQKVNLVSESTLPDVWHRHIWDSAQLAPLIPSSAKTIVDLGSGAGFPGLVLAIILSGPPPPLAGEGDHRAAMVEGASQRPNLTVHLIESTQKKCRFLEAAIAATGAPAKVHCARAEEVPGLKADVVTARAVAPLERLLPLAYPFFRQGTIGLFLKGRSLNDELTGATKSWTLDASSLPSRSDPSGFVLRITGLAPWRKSRKPT